RCPLLGFACAWRPEQQGLPRVRRRTARTKLQAACPRLTVGITAHRPWPERACFQRLQARLRGHSHSDGVRGTSRALTRVFRGARDGTDKGRKRRGGKWSSDTWEPCPRVLDRAKIARPCLTEVNRRSVCACRLGCAPRTRVQPRNRRRENGTSGTVRGVPGNRHSYRRGVRVQCERRSKCRHSTLTVYFSSLRHDICARNAVRSIYHYGHPLRPKTHLSAQYARSSILRRPSTVIGRSQTTCRKKRVPSLRSKTPLPMAKLWL